MKKIFFGITILSTIFLASCTNLLQSTPQGSSANEDQVNESYIGLQSRVRGLYGTMAKGGGVYMGAQKYLDFSTDLVTSDVAMVNVYWGWFVAAARQQVAFSTAGFNGWVWSYEYAVIRNANLLIKACNLILDKENLTADMKTEVEIALGQAYAMRAYAYYQLTNFWANPSALDNKILPYYDENNMDNVQPFTDYAYVVQNVTNDLDRAISLLAKYDRSKLEIYAVDSNIARMLQAYVRINKGRAIDLASLNAECTEVLRLIEDVIATGEYTILPYDQVLTNGFNSTASSPNWMWAADIDVNTTRAINSFWSLTDIFTYGYAAAGEYYALDDSIYSHFDDMLSPTDIRKQWWNDGTDPGMKDFRLSPTNKFFDPARIQNNDRSWLNDLVYMRIEEAYLLGSEAALALNDLAKAKDLLRPLIQQRDPAYVATMDAMDLATFTTYLQNNWRIEMWMEGRSFMAIKRFNWTHERGGNHKSLKGDKVSTASSCFYFEKNYAEDTYNPYDNSNPNP